jgi:hypothetical protein
MMTLSDYKGKQIIRDSIEKCFLQDFRTMFISTVHQPSRLSYLPFSLITGGAGGGTNLIGYYDEINHLMDQLGGGYHLTEIDLSHYLTGGQALPNLIG